MVSIAAIFYSEPPPPPAPKDKCTPVQALRERVEKAGPFRAFRAVSLRQLGAAIALYNALPPPSDVQWDAAYLIDGPDGSGALVVAINGRACGIIVFSAEHYSALLNSIEPRS